MSASIPSSVDAVLKSYAHLNERRVMIGRCVVFSIIFVWLWLNYGRAVAMQELPVLSLFTLNGIILYYWNKGRERAGFMAYLAVVIDCLLLLYTLYLPGRVYPSDWPWPMSLRMPNDAYFLIIIGLSLLAFRVRLILWAGFCVITSFAALHWAIARQSPLTPIPVPVGDDMSLDLFLDPQFVNIEPLMVRGFCIALLTGLLAVAAWRLRQLLSQLAQTLRERGNLARYLAPDLVESLAQRDDPLGPSRQVEATVLFADIKGFTAMAEKMAPEATMMLLRRFHGDMADAVFAQGGTLDKFIGDGLMATFGVLEGDVVDPGLSRSSAARAVACARDMQRRLALWNDERAVRGEPPIAMGIGLNHGVVTIGDIGHTNRLEFAVLGDTVNLASRIEGLTRDFDADILASDAVAAKIDDRTGWRPLGAVQPHGRSGLVELYALSAVPG